MPVESKRKKMKIVYINIIRKKARIFARRKDENLFYTLYCFFFLLWYAQKIKMNKKGAAKEKERKIFLLLFLNMILFSFFSSSSMDIISYSTHIATTM